MHDLAEENNYRFTPTRAYQDKPILGSIDKIYAPTKSSLDQLKKSFEIIFSISSFEIFLTELT